MDITIGGIMEGQYLSGGYYKVTLGGKVHNVHRLIWEEANGPVPEGYVIDHIDRNTLNNDLSNLRAVPRGANKANTVSSRELPKGVYQRKNKSGIVYWGQIRMGGRSETHKATTKLEEVVHWAKETHARMMEETYGIST